MSAATDLGIKPGEYDGAIATFIPHYKALIGAAAAVVDVVARTAPAVVDLGTGSGALAQSILKVRPKARLIGVDADEAMLAAAEHRLRGNIHTINENFERFEVPLCDVVSASFALHHVPTGRCSSSTSLCKRSWIGPTKTESPVESRTSCGSGNRANGKPNSRPFVARPPSTRRPATTTAPQDRKS